MPPAELNPFMLTQAHIVSEEQALGDTVNLINQEVTTFGDELLP